MSTRPYLGTNVNAASVEEMRYRGLVEEGETLLALFDGVLLDQNRRRVGGLAISDYVALTERRVITWARGFFNDAVDSFPWQDVDVVNAETWDPWHGRVQLAFRLPSVAPRKRRVAINGSSEEPGTSERLVFNTLDYMPTDDVAVFARMVELIGDQIVNNVTGEALVAAFVEAFPPVERELPQPFFTTTPEPAPPPVAVEAPAPAPARKRWWQFGSTPEEQQPVEPPVAPATPGDLIAAYERTRGGAPAAGSGLSTLPMQPNAANLIPSLTDQPNMYEVSRSLRLVLEAPRRLARGLRRASEAMGGASELAQGLQDPRVRRNAMRGIYAAAAHQEAQGGPLASVGPVVRAAVRFAEPLEDEQQSEQQSRRIKVRAAVRKAPASSEPEGLEPQPQPQRRPPRQAPQPVATTPPAAATTPPDEAGARPEPLRRSISVRRVEPPAPEREADAQRLPAAEPPAEATPPAAPKAAPVRRIAVNRSERDEEQPASSGPRVVSYNGNGVLRSSEGEV